MRVFLIAVVVGVLLGIAQPSTRAEDVEASVEARLLDAVGDDFWGAVLVRRGEDVLLSRGFGKADLVRKDMTPRSLFDIGSVAKQFTAAAILKLQMQGKLSVEDSLGKHLKDVPDDKAGITIHHLLTHRSGLQSDIAWGTKEAADRDAMVRRVLSEPLLSTPGDEHRLRTGSQPTQESRDGSRLEGRRLHGAGVQLELAPPGRDGRSDID